MPTMNINERRHLAGRLRRFRRLTRLGVMETAAELDLHPAVLKQIERSARGSVRLTTLLKLTEAETRYGIAVVKDKRDIRATGADEATTEAVDDVIVDANDVGGPDALDLDPSLPALGTEAINND